MGNACQIQTVEMEFGSCTTVQPHTIACHADAACLPARQGSIYLRYDQTINNRWFVPANDR